jgi:ATP-binding cassette subfamily B protein
MNKSIVIFFWQYIKPYKWHYLVMLLAPLVSAFYPFAYNYAIKLFLDIIDQSSALSYQQVILPIFILFFTHVVNDTFWRVSNVAEWCSEPYVRRAILLNAYNYVQNHSYTFFQNNFTGALSSKLKGILGGYDKFWAEMHHGLLALIFRIVVSLGALFIINARLGMLVVVWGMCYLPIMYRLSGKLNMLSFAETESRHTLIGQIADKITNIISLFAFSTRRKELDYLDKHISNDFIPKQITLYKYTFKVYIIAGIFYVIMFSVVPFYMVYLAKHNLVTIGDFAFVLGMLLAVTDDIWRVTISLQDFSRDMGDLRSSLSILNIPQQNLDLANANILKVVQPTIQIKNLQFTYDKNKPIFAGLNLMIHAGEKIGLVGHSGAGKSSLVNLLLRYFTCTDGEILIDGQDINYVTQDSLRDNIAVIPQDTMLFHRSIMENIRYGRLDASDAEVIAASKKAHIHEYVIQLPEQYNTYVGERGIKLSGGQRQRVAIARAILKAAPILILDEATSALDSHTEQLIQDSLNFFITDTKKTVIAVAHRLSTLKHMDRIIVLDQGSIVEEGTHANLLANDSSLYKRLWELQEI